MDSLVPVAATGNHEGRGRGEKRRREDVRERKREIGGRGNKVFQKGK